MITGLKLLPFIKVVTFGEGGSLEKRQRRGDMIEVYKTVHNVDKVDKE